MHHSTPGLRVIKKKKRTGAHLDQEGGDESGGLRAPVARVVRHLPFGVGGYICIYIYIYIYIYIERERERERERKRERDRQRGRGARNLPREGGAQRHARHCRHLMRNNGRV